MIDTLELIRIPGNRWKEFESAIIQIENVSFAPSIRDEAETLQRVAESATGIFLVARVSDHFQVVGYLAADIIENCGDVSRIQTDPHFGQRDSIYIVSVAVKPSYRHRGIGMALQKECLRIATREGYIRVTAHVARGTTAKMRGINGRVLATAENWYDTNTAFEYTLLSLSSPGE